MPSRTRLPNKTIWALEDIIALCQTARRDLDQAIKQAEKHMNPVLLTAVARLSQRVAEIEALARDARQGEYNRSTAVSEK